MSTFANVIANELGVRVYRAEARWATSSCFSCAR
jgi:hypothetical protein